MCFWRLKCAAAKKLIFGMCCELKKVENYGPKHLIFFFMELWFQKNLNIWLYCYRKLSVSLQHSLWWAMQYFSSQQQGQYLQPSSLLYSGSCQVIMDCQIISSGGSEYILCSWYLIFKALVLFRRKILFPVL